MTFDYTSYNGSSEENTQTRINSARQKTNFQMPPAPYTIVPEKAKKFETTDRLRSLSAPRIRTEYHLRKGKTLAKNKPLKRDHLVLKFY